MEEIALFAQLLKQHRKARDLTQRALAERVGCAPITIQSIEQGRLRPSRHVAERLAIILDLSPNEHEQFVRLARHGPLADGVGSSQQPAAPQGTAAVWPPTPVPLTPLIGRAHEVATVYMALVDSSVRLVTLTGPGGVGKTRVALQAAAELEATYPDGVVFVDLAPITDPALVAASIAQALGVKEVVGQPLLATLAHHLHRKHCLLVLDNFEQVVAAAPMIAELLQTAPRLQALLTSRFVVGVYGEQRVDVPPLRYPDPAHLLPVEQFIEYEAIRLFAERARATHADFVMGADNAAAVAAICARLDGLPLAIELAAARVALLPPVALLRRLSDRFRLLTASDVNRPARHQSLRATLDWSYDLLAQREQMLFRRLGVFVGGWSLEAAEAVCTVDDLAPDVVEGLQLLLDKSLLRQAQGLEGEPRFTMLETVREYAAERLEESAEAELVWQQHAAYFLALVERAEVGGTSADQVEQEHGNLVAAVTWSQTAGHPDLMVRLVASLAWFWRCHGYWWQQREWLRALLARASGAEPPPIRAARLALAAELADNAEQARPLLEESLALYQEIGDSTGTIRVLTHLANVAYEAGDLRGARRTYRELLALARDGGDLHQLAGVLLTLADLEREEGNYTCATARYEESLALSQQLGSQGGIASYLTGMGDLALYQGEPVRARALYHEALDLFEGLGNRLMLAFLNRNLGRVGHALGDDTQARVFLEESLQGFRTIGFAYGMGAAWRRLRA